MNFDYINNPDRKGLDMGSRYRRYTINIKTGAISFVDTLSYELDNVGFPIINPKWQSKKNCYSYITEIQN